MCTTPDATAPGARNSRWHSYICHVPRGPRRGATETTSLKLRPTVKAPARTRGGGALVTQLSPQPSFEAVTTLPGTIYEQKWLAGNIAPSGKSQNCA